MSDIPDWQEVESEIEHPGRWILFAIGTLFGAIGVGGLFTGDRVFPPGLPLTLVRLGAAFFAIVGGAAMTHAIRAVISPGRVRHAGPDVLPDVPQEPVILEGSVVHGRLMHELVEEPDRWQFRPARKLWRNDQILMFGFGIPFMTLFAGILSWVFHSQQNLGGWPVSILCGICVTLLCGGTAFSLLVMANRTGYRRLCILSIPRNEGDLEYESALPVDMKKTDLASGLNWIFVGDDKRQRFTIPRERLRAVQLCPWKFATTSSRTWAVQGTLVLGCSPEGAYQRLPILLTGDFVGAARLSQQLATTLHVPFLFSGDAAGWKAEAMRANKRRPLRIGGTQT
jgi:hypothetical protein